MAVTPAGAEVAQAAATSWKKIWKKELKPLADKRYYQKSQSDTKYASKAEAAAAAAAAQSAATSAANSATDSKLGGYYKKAESDAKYAPYPTVIRGVWHIALTADASGETSSTDVSFGYTLPAAPTVHYIESGAPVPAGCAGTAAAPDAAPGHLCVFETYEFGSLSTAGIYNLQASTGASTLGAALSADTTASGRGRLVGTWAVRPGSVSSSRQAPAPGRSAD